MTRAHSWDDSLRSLPCLLPSTLTCPAKIISPWEALSGTPEHPGLPAAFYLWPPFPALFFNCLTCAIFLTFGSPLRVSSKCNFFHCRQWELHKLPGRFHGTHGRGNRCLCWYTSDCHIASLQSILQNSQTLFSSWVNLQFQVTISITAIKTSGTGRKEN